jgi:Zn ribbon nucleic-acid-binding protein
MLLLKACPRCQGDLTFDRDARTAYLYCVQCGHTLSIAQEKALGVHASRHGLTHVVPPTRQPAPSTRASVLVPAGSR